MCAVYTVCAVFAVCAVVPAVFIRRLEAANTHTPSRRHNLKFATLAPPVRTHVSMAASGALRVCQSPRWGAWLEARVQWSAAARTWCLAPIPDAVASGPAQKPATQADTPVLHLAIAEATSMWAVEADCATGFLFHLPIAAEVRAAFDAARGAVVAACAPAPAPLIVPHVQYHGTSRRGWDGIAAAGLAEIGAGNMFGAGVYMGGWIKAGRFACFDGMDYRRRDAGDAVIVRVLVLAPEARILTKTLTGVPQRCACVDCAARPSEDDMPRLADHLGTWRSSWAAVRVPPTQRDATRWWVRNAEMCARAECVVTRDAVLLDVDSLPAGNYDPTAPALPVLAA